MFVRSLVNKNIVNSEQWKKLLYSSKSSRWRSSVRNPIVTCKILISELYTYKYTLYSQECSSSLAVVVVPLAKGKEKTSRWNLSIWISIFLLYSNVIWFLLDLLIKTSLEINKACKTEWHIFKIEKNGNDLWRAITKGYLSNYLYYVFNKALGFSAVLARKHVLQCSLGSIEIIH